MKWRRPLAAAALFLIAALYLITLVLAFTGSPDTGGFLMAALFCTIVLPAMIYAYQLAWRISHRKREDEESGRDEG